MFLLFGAFIAGMLTVLAPCVLPLLPIIIGGSVTGDSTNRKRPLIIAASLAVSLIVFTLLLKVTTLLINVPPSAITYFSGGIIIALGIVTLFPGIYATIIGRLGIEQRATKTLGKGFGDKRQWLGPVITGAALGPVFSSCSPVYAYILATVLPVNFGQAFAYIISYVLGLSVLLLLIGFYGQKLIKRIKFASNPRGWFQRIIAILFIIVGLMIITGYDKKFQTYISSHTPFNLDAISSSFLPASKNKVNSSSIYNVTPYAAPEFTGLDGWINSDPQTIKQLKGKIVLVDFWTYSCINCIRNNPYLEKWYNTYKDNGLVVVGIHAPEFSFEKITANVQQAVKAQGITYPVALDNEFSTWNAYDNRSWPASYLIDARGQVVRVHEGEGQYQQEEDAIRTLLTNNGANLDGKQATTTTTIAPITSAQTPETYLGYNRASNYSGTPALAAQPSNTFTPAGSLNSNQWSLGGNWEVQGQKIIAKGNSTLQFKVSAKDVYLVGGSGSQPQQVSIKINGQPIESTGFSGADISGSSVAISESKLYKIADFKKFTNDQLIEITVPDGVELNTFTFGS
jgi:cytochrome c biogenesis protein CcdA/thiol-disulfide isomerase/thioredoxin